MEKSTARILVSMPAWAVLFVAMDLAAHVLGQPLTLVLLIAWGFVGCLWLAAAIWTRRKLRFGMQATGLFVAICAALLASWTRYVEPFRAQHRAIAEIEALNGRYETDFDEAVFLRQHLGDNFARHVVEASFRGTALSDDELTLLRRLPKLRILDIGDTKVTDGGLRHLRNLPELESLSCLRLPITDSGLTYLSKVPSITRLNLSQTKITDNGLAQLHVLPSLRVLRLDETAITDEGIEAISRLPQLEELHLFQCQVTDDGIRHILNMAKLKKLGADNTRISPSGKQRINDELLTRR